MHPKWAKDEPTVTILYELFCDLVHPNIGSTLLVAHRHASTIEFGGDRGEQVGHDIVFRTIAGLASLFGEIQRHLETMLLLQMHETEGL
jgi:hypothetical protein